MNNRSVCSFGKNVQTVFEHTGQGLCPPQIIAKLAMKRQSFAAILHQSYQAKEGMHFACLSHILVPLNPCSTHEWTQRTALNGRSSLHCGITAAFLDALFMQ